MVLLAARPRRDCCSQSEKHQTESFILRKKMHLNMTAIYFQLLQWQRSCLIVECMAYQQPWEVKAIQHTLPNGELSGKIFCLSRTGLSDWLTVAKALSTLKVHFVFFTGNALQLVNTRSAVMTGNTSTKDIWTLSLKVNIFIRSLNLAIPSMTDSFEDYFYSLAFYNGFSPKLPKPQKWPVF